MASASKKKEVEMFLMKHPEMIIQEQTKFGLTYMSIALTMAFDWIIQRDQADGIDPQADCDELMDYFTGQFKAITDAGWIDYADTVSKAIKKDIGYSPLEYIAENFVKKI